MRLLASSKASTKNKLIGLFRVHIRYYLSIKLHKLGIINFICTITIHNSTS
jgi:hypothetical protein